MATATKKSSKKGTKHKTHCCIILDRSGSMYSSAEKAVEGYNENVEQFLEEAKDPEQDVDVSVVTFNGNVFEHLWCEPADKLEKASRDSFQPSGSTALLDGIGYVLDKYTSMPDADDKDVAYLVIIISDGGENASQHYEPDRLTELFQGCDASDRYTFSFLGCSKSDLAKFKTISGGVVNESNMAQWSNTKKGARRAMRANKTAIGGYFKLRKAAGASGASNKFFNFYGAGGVADYSDEGANATQLDASVQASSSPGFGTADVFVCNSENIVTSQKYAAVRKM